MGRIHNNRRQSAAYHRQSAAYHRQYPRARLRCIHIIQKTFLHTTTMVIFRLIHGAISSEGPIFVLASRSES
jgi:hypothetical protein